MTPLIFNLFNSSILSSTILNNAPINTLINKAQPVMAKDFTFKQFHINAAQCGMPVSTDAILLGAWAKVESVKTILDIGCGTGLLAIMCAQRNSTAYISAIEIEEKAFNAAVNNCQSSPWSPRLTVSHCSLQTFTKGNNTFDTIICNPPYFNSGEESKATQRAVARHTSMLSHQTLITYCQQLLNNEGVASFVLPKQEGLAFINLLENEPNEGAYLQLSRLTYVKTTINKSATRVLIELTKSTLLPVLKTSELTIHDGQGYSSDFIQLTKDFYLKM